MTEHPIRRYCNDLGITQNQFAVMVGINPTQISYFINGHRKPRADQALRIHFNTGGAIDLQELLGWGEDKPLRDRIYRAAR